MWYYNNKVIDSIEQFPEGSFGFIYKISCIDTGKFYVGRKNLYSERNVKMNKKELAEEAALKKPGKKRSKKLVIKESDWLKYYGSEPELKQDIKKLGPAAFKREILHITFSKKATTYREIYYQMILGVLESTNCYNSNISGYYFRNEVL